MKIYLVGGAVRDRLLDLTVKDHDWVVVGSTPEAMITAGFRPIGQGFPVFLHPKTQEEYALARTERKSGHGYSGFVFHAAADVSLEEDLLRRDLTINAMAQDEDGSIFDPYGGQEDLKNRKLRHVSKAFEEDPLRVLRIARFAARFHLLDFVIAEETLALMKKMVTNGELAYLVPERVWQETSRALMEASPDVYFSTLIECGALQVIMPCWYQFLKIDSPAFSALNSAVAANENQRVRFTCLFPPNQAVSLKDLKKFNKQMRFPSAFTDRSLLMNEHQLALVSAQKQIEAGELVALFEKTDAFRKKNRFVDVLTASYLLATASGVELKQEKITTILQSLDLCCSISAKPFIEKGYKGKDVGVLLRKERIMQLSKFLSSGEL